MKTKEITDTYHGDPVGSLIAIVREAQADVMSADARDTARAARAAQRRIPGDRATALEYASDGRDAPFAEATYEREHNRASRVLAAEARAQRDAAASLRAITARQARCAHEAVVAPRDPATGRPRACYADPVSALARASAGATPRAARPDRLALMSAAERGRAFDALRSEGIEIDTHATRRSRKRKRRGKRGGRGRPR